jgi:hypothetical protein
MRHCPTVFLKILSLGSLSLLVGCATTVSLNDAERAELKTNGNPIQTLLYTSMGSNGLMITTPKTAMAYVGAGFVAIKNGKEWSEENSIHHPMATLRDRVTAKLKSDLGVYSFKPIADTYDVSNDAPEKLKVRLGNGLLMDFSGVYQVIYYVADMSHYHMYYNARARLLRLDDGKVMWQGNCRTDIEDPDNRPTIDDLRANQAARLKEWLNRGASECGLQLTNHFFGRNT